MRLRHQSQTITEVRLLVVDPGFLRRRGVAIPDFGGKNLLWSNIFTENCMKMKEIKNWHVPIPS